jgi:hypothetical protein
VDSGNRPAAKPHGSIATSVRNIAHALLSGADGWMFDGEDALGQLSTMSLDNQRNLKRAIDRERGRRACVDPSVVHPNIDAITMTYGYMRNYEDRVRRAVTTPDRLGGTALWQGGMEPNIPVGTKAGVEAGMKKAVGGAEREQREGAKGLFRRLPTPRPTPTRCSSSSWLRERCAARAIC